MIGTRALWLAATIAVSVGSFVAPARDAAAQVGGVRAEPAAQADAAEDSGSRRARRRAAREADREEEPAAPGDAPPVESATTDVAADPLDPFDALVLERRRRDFPAFEQTESGFTITEQIRIAPDVRADYQRAVQLLEQERFAEGIPLLLGVTEEAPEVTAPYIDLGIAYGRIGELELAEESLLRASQLSPEHPIIHNELGILYRRTGRFAAARASYEKALDVYPGFHFARRNLAVLCDLYLADPQCALRNYSAYLEEVLADEEAEIWVADIRNRLGQ